MRSALAKLSWCIEAYLFESEDYLQLFSALLFDAFDICLRD